MGAVARNGTPRSQNRHVVRKAVASDNDGIPEPIEGRPTERVDTSELRTLLEKHRLPAPAESLEIEVTRVRERAPSEPPSNKLSTARLAHTLKRPARAKPGSAKAALHAAAKPVMIAKGSAANIRNSNADELEASTVVKAEGSGPLEPMLDAPIPEPIHEAATTPSPSFEAVFDASKLIEPLRRHGERVASLEGTEAAPLRKRDVALGVVFGLAIVSGAWLTIASLI